MDKGFLNLGIQNMVALVGRSRLVVAPLVLALAMTFATAITANSKSEDSAQVVQDVDFGPYMAKLQRTIKRHWFPPRGEESRRVTVVFKIAREGQLSSLRINKSSDSTTADLAAMKAVETAAPFEGLPSGSPEVVDIQFTFDYNVFGGGNADNVATSQESNESTKTTTEETATETTEQPKPDSGDSSSANVELTKADQSDTWVPFAFGGALLTLLGILVVQGRKQDTSVNLKSSSSDHKPSL